MSASLKTENRNVNRCILDRHAVNYTTQLLATSTAQQIRGSSAVSRSISFNAPLDTIDNFVNEGGEAWRDGGVTGCRHHGVTCVDKCRRLSQSSWLLGALWNSLFTYLLTYLLRLQLQWSADAQHCERRSSSEHCSACLTTTPTSYDYIQGGSKLIDCGLTAISEQWGYIVP